MARIRVVRTIALIVTLSGLAAMLGWVFDVQVLKSVLPSMVTMKFTTAVSFLLSGLTLFFMSEGVSGRASVAQIVLPATALIIMLVMATLLASALLGFETGIEEMFVREEPTAVKTTVPGRPSVVTMADFIFIAIAAIATLFRSSGKRVLFPTGVFLMATGVLALSGYALGIEYLYFSWPGYSTGMALVTAFLFLLIGLGILILAGGA